MSPLVTDLIAAAGALLLLDQWSKWVVRVLRIRHVNSSRGLYTRGRTRAGLVVTWVVALACAAALHASGATFQSQPSRWGVGAALGGAAGNLLDILRRRSVLDFIDLRWWPVFNVADVGIVAGLVVAFWPPA
jgi:signal peptidase II